MSSLSQIDPKIIQIDEDEYLVSSFNPKTPNEQYQVKILEKVNQFPILLACSCPHFTYRQVQCKHIAIVIDEVMNRK